MRLRATTGNRMVIVVIMRRALGPDVGGRTSRSRLADAAFLLRVATRRSAAEGAGDRTWFELFTRAVLSLDAVVLVRILAA